MLVLLIILILYFQFFFKWLAGFTYHGIMLDYIKNLDHIVIWSFGEAINLLIFLNYQIHTVLKQSSVFYKVTYM